MVADKILLKVTISDKTGIKAYGLAFGGVPVPMNRGKGSFEAEAGKKELLEWVMLGEPGGTMKVVVNRGTTEIKKRDKSTIPPGEGRGFDAFEIEVNA